jgi:hypothetical protein
MIEEALQKTLRRLLKEDLQEAKIVQKESSRYIKRLFRKDLQEI